jgi:hypothetical protein
MKKISREEKLRALDAMYFEWFSNGPENMPSEGRHKEIYLAIRAALAEPSVTQQKLTEIIRKYVPCHCDPAYTDRGLTAPDCPRHAWVDEETLADMFKEIGVEIEEERDEKP